MHIAADERDEFEHAAADDDANSATTDDDEESLLSTFELASESTRQVQIAEQTALEMQQAMDYWNSTTTTTSTTRTAPCTSHNSLMVIVEEDSSRANSVEAADVHDYNYGSSSAASGTTTTSEAMDASNHKSTHFLPDESDASEHVDDAGDALTTTISPLLSCLSTLGVSTTESAESTMEVASESTLQIHFAEQTALEMKEVMDYWKATTTTTTATPCMPHNSLSFMLDEEEENDASDWDHGHDDEEDDATVSSSFSSSIEEARPHLPPLHVLLSRVNSASSNLTCVTTEDDDDDLAEPSFPSFRKGSKIICDNASTTTAVTMMNSVSSDNSTSNSASSHDGLMVPVPLSRVSSFRGSSSSSGAIIWSDDDQRSIHHNPVVTHYDQPPPILLAPPITIECRSLRRRSRSSLSSSSSVKHFHWTACQQQTQVNMACSRAQWMSDCLASLFKDHIDHSLIDTCDAQQPLLLRPGRRRTHKLLLRRWRQRIMDELYIGFCQALPFEYFRLWVWCWKLGHSYMYYFSKTSNHDSHRASSSACSSERFVKTILTRDLLLTSIVILVLAMRMQPLPVQQPHVTPCLVCFQVDEAEATSNGADAFTSLRPSRSYDFETIHSSHGDDWPLL